MNYAYVTSTPQLVEHSNNAWGNFQMRLYYIPPVVVNNSNSSNSTNSTQNNSTSSFPSFPTGDDTDTGGLLDLRAELEGYDILYLHGWLLWLAWGVLGFV